MIQPEQFDTVILGGGNGGMYLAWHLARSGERVAVIEERWIGGSCPNVNCLPTKNVIWSAKVADLARHGEMFGTMKGPVTVDMTRVRQRKRDMVEQLIAGTLEQYANSGAELILGRGQFIAPKTIEVALNDGGTRVLRGEHIVVNLGTRATIPDIPGLSDAGFLTNIEALELDYVPEHLVVFGGGYVGLELAQAFRRFGSRVTVVERGPHIAGPEDPDVADEVRRIFNEENIDIFESAEACRVQGRSGDRVVVHVSNPSGDRTIEGSDILVGVGRTPNTTGIGLDIAGIEVDQRGYVIVNDRLETSAPGAWGVGESSAGNPQFTHVSFDDYRILRDNMAGGNRKRQDRLVPHCVFIDPQLARIGLTEKELRHRGIEVRIAKLPMSAVLRTLTLGETKGFMKAIVARNSDHILGFTMIGPEAGEVLCAVQVAMLGELPYTCLRDALIAHPTMSEGLNALFSMIPSAAMAAVTSRA